MSLIEQRATGEDINKGRVLVATTLVWGHGLKHLYTAAFTIILPEIKAGLALSNVATGALVTARDLSGGIITLPSGFVADRFGSRWAAILTVAILLVGLGYLLAGAFPSYWVVTAAVVLAGVGTSLWHPAAIASLSKRFPRRRGFALALHGTGGTVGEVLGPIIAGGLLLALAWEHLMQASMVPILVAAAFTWAALRGMSGQKGVSNVGAYFSAAVRLFRSRILMAVVLLSGARSMSHHTVAIFIPIYLREDLEYSPFIVGVYVSLLQVAGIATQPIMGLLSDRFGRKAVLTPGMISFGLLCFALAFAAPGVPLTLTILAIGAFIFTFHAIFVAAAIDLSEEEVRGTAVALVYASSNAIGSIGPLLGGVLADAYGVEATFLFAGGVVVAAALLLGALRLPKVRPATAAGSS